MKLRLMEFPYYIIQYLYGIVYEIDTLNCSTLTLTLTLKIVYLDTSDILHLNYYVQHIGNKNII